MKIIDLLNKIAKGEEVPKIIQYRGYIYEYQHRRDTENAFNYMCNENGEYLSGRYYLDNILNDEIEIIEEEKEIEELSWQHISYKNIEGVFERVRDIKDIVIDTNNQIDKIGNKINELVRKLNKIKKEGK